jgi:hypothetical protein
MRKVPLLMLLQFGLLAGLSADVVTLKDGRQISGLVESGNLEELRIKVANQSQNIDIHEVQAIQFGDSSPTPPPPTKAAKLAPATPESAPNSLILKDGTHVAGRVWSIDTTSVHFLVDNQFQQYPRHDVLQVILGDATPAPPPPERSTPPPAASAQPPARVPQPTPAPALARSSAPPAQPPSLTRPSGSAPPSAPTRPVSQPEQTGMVYFWNGTVLIPLEATQAAERKSGSTPYWEMPAAQSPIRLNQASSLVFILRLPQGVDPRSYNLFPLVSVNGSRRTQSQPGRPGVLATGPVDIKKNDESSLITYALTVRDLPVGEYAFSPSNSNNTYCFGVDPSAPGRKEQREDAAANPPEDSEPTPDRVPLGVRSADPLIRKAAEAALQFTQTLPNYVCKEVVSRYESNSRPTSFHVLDVVSTDVVYENGKEDYRNITVDGRPANKSVEETGAWSTGEFGTLLIDLFAPATAADFRPNGEDRIGGITAKVYTFDVRRENSNWILHFGPQTYQPAYRGTTWIDPRTARVLRVELEARDLPSGFPTDHVESAVDYQYVRLGGEQEYLLPVHAATLSCQRGTPFCSKNNIDFRNYHKYTGESSIQFGDAVPDNSSAPAAPQPRQ